MANPVWCIAAVEPREDYIMLLRARALIPAVTSVEPREDYTMLLTCENGEKRLYDARPLLSKPICSELKNIHFFMKAEAMYGTVVWNDDVDIAPEHLYECSTPIVNAANA